jgi:TPR repeat protein
MPRIMSMRTVRVGAAGLVCAALSLGTALPGGVPAAQAADLYTHHRAAGGGEAASVRHTIALAQRGNARAQAMLGFMYENGQGVPQSYDQAAGWYERSAEQGDPNGQYLLGLMYDKGFGVKADVVVAQKWLELATAHASRQNRDNFTRIRDAVRGKMTRPQIELAQQLAVDFIPVRE